MMKLKRIVIFVFVLGLFGMTHAITILDSADFDYKYEMDVQPYTQDLDGNSSKDWWDGGYPQVVDGYAVRESDEDEGEYFRTDFGGSVWRENVTLAYTVEISVQALTTGTEGDHGTIGVYGNPIDHTGGPYLIVARAGQGYWDGSGTVDLGSQDNTDGQHIFRIAFDDNGDAWLWRDTELLNPGGSALAGDLNVFNNNILQVGDIWSTGTSGDYKLDYVRLTAGAYAPVPEPATMALLGLGAFAALIRRK